MTMDVEGFQKVWGRIPTDSHPHTHTKRRMIGGVPASKQSHARAAAPSNHDWWRAEAHATERVRSFIRSHRAAAVGTSDNGAISDILGKPNLQSLPASYRAGGLKALSDAT